ncbi:MAG: hypothetical protein VW268_07430 [Rhodospirillaceae bacterium]
MNTQIRGTVTAKGQSATPASRAQGKSDRERFVALAFCRANLLIELDTDYTIVFAAGVTPVLGATPETLKGQSFLDFVGAEHKGYAKNPVVFSGYWMPDFSDHYCLSLKVEPIKKTYVSKI